jgi:hypothetical protein
MVPQKRYKPHTSSDRRRYVEEVQLEPSTYFSMSGPGELGIPLRDALHGRFAKLVGRDEPILFQERGPSISVRLNVSSGQLCCITCQIYPNPYLTLYKTSGQVINRGVVRFLQKIFATLLGLLHVRNSPRMWPNPSLGL